MTLARFVTAKFPSLVMASLLALPLVQCGSDSSTFDASDEDGGANNGGFGTVCTEEPCSDDDASALATCGDGNLALSESCDDANTKAGDGCSPTCELEPGWTCPTPGLPCEATKCGDGILAGVEECELPDGQAITGCSEDCKIQPGFDCDPVTFVCKAVVCGNGKVERGETCEDGNTLPFDGCYNCQKEPSCKDGVCEGTCGDGRRFANEECDDGNMRDGDGCSSDCKIEQGFDCKDEVNAPAPSIELPVLARDFIGVDNEINGAVPHENFNRLNGNGVRGIVEPNLDNKGRMVLNCPDGDCTQNPGHLYTGSGNTRPNITTKERFDEWYRPNAANIPSVVTLSVDRQPNGNYVWDSEDTAQNGGKNYFDPVGTDGWIAKGFEQSPSSCGGNRNVSWTTETHFWFEYQGGESFEFSGDDDTWIFINGRLALDLGGLHGKKKGTVTLRSEEDTDVDFGTGDARFSSDMPGNPSGTLTLGLKKDGVYELVMFQAERNQCGSNFKVTFKEFNRPKSICQSTCGDGIVASNEVCDDGKNDGSYGGCMPGCKARGPRCGDGIVQADQGEQCDDGNLINNDGCSNGCRYTNVN